MNLKKPIGLWAVPIAIIISFGAIFYAVKIGSGPPTDNSGLTDAMALLIAIFFSFITGLIVGLMVIFGKKR